MRPHLTHARDDAGSPARMAPRVASWLLDAGLAVSFIAALSIAAAISH